MNQPFRNTLRANTGYTLVEMMIVVAILAIVIALPLASIRTARRDALLQAGQATVVGALSQAHSRAMSGVDGASHGVHIDTSAVILFSGTTYTGAGTVYPLPAGVEAHTGGASDLVFSRLSGETSNETVTLLDAGGSVETITVHEYGAIEY